MSGKSEEYIAVQDKVREFIGRAVAEGMDRESISRLIVESRTAVIVAVLARLQDEDPEAYSVAIDDAAVDMAIRSFEELRS